MTKESSNFIRVEPLEVHHCCTKFGGLDTVVLEI